MPAPIHQRDGHYLLSLSVIVSTRPPIVGEGSTGAIPTPSIEQIFGKYLAAVGGNPATSSKTLVLKGKRESSQRRNSQNEITAAFPNKFVIAITPQSTKNHQWPEGVDSKRANVRNLSATEPPTRGVSLESYST